MKALQGIIKKQMERLHYMWYQVKNLKNADTKA